MPPAIFPRNTSRGPFSNTSMYTSLVISREIHLEYFQEFVQGSTRDNFRNILEITSWFVPGIFTGISPGMLKAFLYLKELNSDLASTGTSSLDNSWNSSKDYSWITYRDSFSNSSRDLYMSSRGIAPETFNDSCRNSSRIPSGFPSEISLGIPLKMPQSNYLGITSGFSLGISFPPRDFS